ncbi:DHA2 family efflux MFS transporter permease subunit [Actinomadura sp. KC345]|uniref:MFS transporter n=1 Tax=Actinomadura sp. KC345 TaxID=2530371 RepID=UPI00104D5AFD|nr:MFS transporter [Actinomadura sp. KC345]TDC58367.1 DHA2 family efflux MFS transporter permease subunit [Actinomadura sp. KC345]
MSSQVRLSEPAGRRLLLVTAVGSGLVLLESTVVNIALPALGTDLGASMAGLQWTVNAFTLTLSALILLGGGLGDRFGRRRIYLIGVVWFGLASLLCGIAPNVEVLVVARALQGVGGALIVPGSLALIQDSFHPEDRNRAVGWWAGMSGVAGAAGPLLGGGLVDAAGWRWVFLINIPLAAALCVLLVAHVAENRDVEATGRFDVAGAVLAAVALAGLTYTLIQGPAGAWTMVAGTAGVAGFVAFLLVERRSPAPMLPLRLFTSRQFSVANLTSFLVYGALAGMFFFLPIQLQVTTGFSAWSAGLALLPLTALTLVLSPYGGELTTRLGARMPLVAGSLICTIALLLATRIGPEASYLGHVLPVVVLTGIGIPLITPAVTTAVLGAVDDRSTGIASAVNNGAARAAGLVVVAALPLLVGLPHGDGMNAAALDRGYDHGMMVCAGLFLVGGLSAWIGLPGPAAKPVRLLSRRHASATCPQLEPHRN